MSKNTTTSTREKNVPFEYENAYEEWSTAGIGNTFLFGKVMTSNPNLLLELLQYSLPEFHIKQIENPEKEADVKLSIDAHGVRLDVITTDDKGRRIDVEMQMRDEKNIPRRMRYYEGSIDQTTLEKGKNVYCKSFLEKVADIFGECCISILEKCASPWGDLCRPMEADILC